MSETRFTPGPWKWWTSNSWRRLKRDDYGITQNVLEPYVCPDGHPDLSISDADMAVIAASPDMYAALQAVEEWWLSEGMNHFNGAPYAMFAARSALRKARGEP